MKRKEIVAAVADLASDDPEKRLSAVQRLGTLPLGHLEDHPLPKSQVKEHLPGLAKLLLSKCSDLEKEWCAQLIGESGVEDVKYLPALIHVLDSKHDRTLMCAIWAIGTFKSKAAAATEALLKLTAHTNRDVRWRAVWALGEIEPSERAVSERCISLFDDSELVVREHAVRAFIATAEPSQWAIQQLARFVNGSESNQRFHAPLAVERWRKALQDEDSAD